MKCSCSDCGCYWTPEPFQDIKCPDCGSIKVDLELEVSDCEYLREED